MIQIIKSHPVTTRKSHNCFGCNREFPSGTQMERQVVRDDNSLYTIHLCPTCDFLVSEELNDGDTYCQGDFRENALEYESQNH